MRGGFYSGHCIPRINYALAPPGQLSLVNHIVGGGDDAGIKAGVGWLVPGVGFGARPVGMLAGGFNHRDVVVVVRNLGAVFSHQPNIFYYLFISSRYSRQVTFFSS